MLRSALLCFGLSLFVFLFAVETHAEHMEYAGSAAFTSSSTIRPSCMALDPWGDKILVGELWGTVDFGTGMLSSTGGVDIFVVRLDPAGDAMWSVNFGGTYNDMAMDVEIDDSGNIYIVGTFSGSVDFGVGTHTSAGLDDMFILKLDRWGTPQWSKSYGNVSNDSGNSVAIDNSGNVVMAGSFYSEVDFGGGLVLSTAIDGVLLKLDSNGNYISALIVSGNYTDKINEVVITPDGHTAIAGLSYSNDLDLGGGTLPFYGNGDTFLGMFDSDNNHIWSTSFGGANYDELNGMASAGDGSVTLIGAYAYAIDIGPVHLDSGSLYLARFDAAGTLQWANGLGAIYGTGRVTGVVCDSAGNPFIAGYASGTMNFGGGPMIAMDHYEVFVAKFTSSGQYIWQDMYRGTGLDAAYDLDIDVKGNLTLTGSFTNDLDFGNNVINALGFTDAFLLTLNRAAPQIASIRDVPGDQGGLVQVAWDGSTLDDVSNHAITDYTMWRGISPTKAVNMAAAGVAMLEDPGMLDKTHSGPQIRVNQSGDKTFYWELINTIPAAYIDHYAAAVPTLFDSTSVSQENHYFQVIAHTDTPWVFFESMPDSGYSVDNLPPGAPILATGAQVAPTQVDLRWNRNLEQDLEDYRVYRGFGADFVPNAGTLVSAVTDTLFSDVDWAPWSNLHYKVSAVDMHGNEGRASAITYTELTGVDTPPELTAAFLSPAVPNPFNPTTQIKFGLARDGAVRLDVFDTAGRLVRTLADGFMTSGQHSATWNGRDDSGRSVTSGTYFMRLQTQNFTQAKKLILLK